MSIHCRCPACGASFKAKDQQAGRKVRCPKCSGPMVLQDIHGEERLAVAQCLDDESQEPVAADQGRKPPARGAAAPGGFPHIVTDQAGTGESHSRAVPRAKRRGKSPMMRPEVLIAVGGGALLLIIVVGIILATSPGEPEKKPQARRSGSRTKAPHKTGDRTSTPAFSVLVLDWPEADRGGSTVQIDREQQTVPAAGRVRFNVKPGRHRIVMLRRGYEPIETTMAFEGGREHEYRPAWNRTFGGDVAAPGGPPEDRPDPSDVALIDTPTPGPDSPGVEPTNVDDKPQPEPPGLDDWLQDFELAKQQAAEQGKDVLLLFNGSDWCPYCTRLASEVLLVPAFAEKVGEKYVPVCLDFPRKPAARAKVKNAVRNTRLKVRYGVSGFPKVVLTDPAGKPFGVISGYVPGGVNAFVERLDRCQALRGQLAELFDEIEKATDPKGKRETIIAAVEVLQANGLLTYYRDHVEAWMAGRSAPEAEPEPEPKEPPVPRIELAEDDLAKPQQAIEKLGLSGRSGYLCLAGDLEFRNKMGGTESLKIKAFEAQRTAGAAEQKAEQKRQVVMALFRQRQQLRAQLARTGSFKTATAVDELGDRIIMLEESDEVEKAAEKARGQASQAAEQYVEHLLAVRRLHDRVLKHYAALAEHAQVKAVIEKYNAGRDRPDELGPSRYFLNEARQLKRLEGDVLAAEIQLRRGGGDLWYVTVMLNGKHAQEMAIDTGASVIALPWGVAQAAGLDPGGSGDTVYVEVADGRVLEAKRVFAKTVRVGKFTVENVACTVFPPELANADPLLGLSFLKKFAFKIDAARGKLIMSQIGTGESKK